MIRYLIRQARNSNQDSSNPPTSRRDARQQRLNARRNPQSQQQPVYGNTDPNAGPNHLGQQYDATGNTYPPVNREQPQRSMLEIWAPRLRLLGAVFLPVILETLDYTSTI
jgi:hypothetical protein